MLTADLHNCDLKNYNLVLLTLELSNFGLLPTQWKLEEVFPTIYKITNKIDPNYSFIGQVILKKNLKTWAYIELHTI